MLAHFAGSDLQLATTPVCSLCRERLAAVEAARATAERDSRRALKTADDSARAAKEAAHLQHLAEADREEAVAEKEDALASKAQAEQERQAVSWGECPGC